MNFTYKQISLFVTFFCLLVSSFAQNDETFKSKFEEANVLMEDKYYNLALPIWKDLAKMEPENANVNAKIGMCYYYSPTHTIEGIPYFKKAIKNIVKNYDPFMYTEKGAKYDTYYYYAHALHIHDELDSAIFYFQKFIDMAGKKHFLTEKAYRQIEMCNNAKKLMAEPVNVRITNMGPIINSPYSEHSPLISLDESELIFTSRRLRKDSSNLKHKDYHDGEYYEDIYISYRDMTGHWSEPELLNFNRYTVHHASVGLSADNQTLYIYHDDEGNGNLYQSVLLGDKWSKPEPLSDVINSEKYETHLTLAVDGKSMYFTSDRKGGYGGLDIYVTRKLPNGEWGEPQNLGPTINTKWNEENPHMHADGKTLYFSSEGHESMGGYDIFFTELQTDGSWSTPTNLGYPINSTHDDVSYAETPDGQRAYYASFGGDKNVGEKDIYLIEQVEALEKALTLLKGHVTVEGDQEIPNNLMIYLTDNETGKMVAESRPIKRNGSYVFIIPPGKNYNISFDMDGESLYNENIFVPYGTEYNEINKVIMLDAVNLTGKSMDNVYTVKLKHLDADKAENLNLVCVDDAGNILFTEKVKKDGTVMLEKLPADKNYLFKLQQDDGTLVDCKDQEIKLFHGRSLQGVFVSDDACAFKNAEESKWKVTFKTLGKDMPNDLVLKCLDDDGNLLFSTQMKQSEEGFAYIDLPQDKNYLFKLYDTDGKMVDCEGVEIELFKDRTDKAILLPSTDCAFLAKKDKKGKVGKVAFVNLNEIPSNLQIQYVDDNGTILFTEKIDDKGYFKFNELPGNSKIHLKLIGDVPCDNANLKVVQADNEAVVFISFEPTDACNFVPVKVEKAQFEEFFSYNKNIPKREKELAAFVKEVKNIVDNKGFANMAIESSASRVPTKTYGTNENLSKIRAEKAKEMILAKLKEQGVQASEVKFIDVTTLVQGPKYKGDYLENRATYEKYQYVKLKAE